MHNTSDYLSNPGSEELRRQLRECMVYLFFFSVLGIGRGGEEQTMEGHSCERFPHLVKPPIHTYRK